MALVNLLAELKTQNAPSGTVAEMLRQVLEQQKHEAESVWKVLKSKPSPAATGQRIDLYA
ncbi:MAG: hypothetical protein FJ030_17225 [Chloroflexi bacterium]|nr:hypothetical protein [Chloroflexota bacterium]